MNNCLNNCIKVNEDHTKENPRWSVDLTFLANNEEISSNDKKKFDNKSLFSKLLKYEENGSNPAISQSAKDLQTHPVSRLYIHQRWAEMKWIYYTLIMFCHFVYSITFSTYAILVFKSLCPLSIDENYYSNTFVFFTNGSSMENHFLEEVECKLQDHGQFLPGAGIATFAWICLIIFTLVLVVREMTEFFDQKWRNFIETDTWIHIFFVIMFFLCSLIL